MGRFQPWEYVDERRVRVIGGPPENPKKITGTRFGAILNLHKWKSPFGAWCEITRVAEEPFETNKYTQAGEALEPKLLEWAKREITPHIVSPGEYFNTSHKVYDHFQDERVFGGQWDALALDKQGGKPVAVVEAKTSSRPQDWRDGVPAQYAAQALLYAHLLGVERAFVVVRFMEPHEYTTPEACECTDDNTFLYELVVKDAPLGDMDVDEAMAFARDWWTRHVEGNISPEFDEKRDMTYLDVMTTTQIDEGGDLEALAGKIIALETELAVLKAEFGVGDLEAQIDTLRSALKAKLLEGFGPNDKVVTAYGWRLKRTQRVHVDTKALERDGLLERYSSVRESYILTRENDNANREV